MATMIREIFTDDIDGSEAAGTTRFSIDGDDYEIDLSGENADKLHAALAPFITKARAVRAHRSTGRGRRGAGSTSRAMSREKSTEIRKWAQENGIQVSVRGRIAASVISEYEAAH